MAMNALRAHKLRSALTLLGVLIGVFSIIVVMTAMRVLKHSVETGLSELGSQTFAIQRWPEAQFGDNSDWQKYWRRKYVTLDQGRRVEEKATLAAVVGIHGDFWRGQISTRYAKTAPTSELYGETPGSFPARNWDVEEGRALSEDDVDNARDVCARQHPGQNRFSIWFGDGRRDQNQRLQIHGGGRARLQGRGHGK